MSKLTCKNVCKSFYIENEEIEVLKNINLEWFEEKSNNLVISNDEVLSIISLYWFTQSITSSARLYKENGDFGFSFNNINQPMAGAIFKRDIMLPPRAWAEKIYDVVQWNEYEGGHFAALERPETLAKDLIKFINKLEI